MHLFPNEAENSQTEEDIPMSSVCDSIFCPMPRLSSSDYIHRWKQIPKTSEQQFVIGKLFTSKLDNIVKRLQSQHIMICVFKKTDTNVKINFNFQLVLYLSAITKDNSLILAELTILHSDFFYGKIKYKSQNNSKESQFENLIAMLMSEADEDEEEDVMCRQMKEELKLRKKNVNRDRKYIYLFSYCIN